MSGYGLNDRLLIPGRHKDLLSAKSSRRPTIVCASATEIKRPERVAIVC
jgi:hypothetical protein